MLRSLPALSVLSVCHSCTCHTFFMRTRVMLSPGVHAVQLAEAAAGVRSAPVSPLGSPAGSPAGRGRGRGRGRRTGGRSRGESPRNGAEAAARGDEARSVPAPEAGLGSEVGFRAHAAASAAPPARDADARRGGGGPEPGDGYADGKPPAPLFPAVQTPAPCHKLVPSTLLEYLITPAHPCRRQTVRRCRGHAALPDACMLSRISLAGLQVGGRRPWRSARAVVRAAERLRGGRAAGRPGRVLERGGRVPRGAAGGRGARGGARRRGRRRGRERRAAGRPAVGPGVLPPRVCGEARARSALWATHRTARRGGCQARPHTLRCMLPCSTSRSAGCLSRDMRDVSARSAAGAQRSALLAALAVGFLT